MDQQLERNINNLSRGDGKWTSCWLVHSETCSQVNGEQKKKGNIYKLHETVITKEFSYEEGKLLWVCMHFVLSQITVSITKRQKLLNKLEQLVK